MYVLAGHSLAKYPFVGDSSLREEGLTGTVPYMAPEILLRKPYGLPVGINYSCMHLCGLPFLTMLGLTLIARVAVRA